MLMARQDDDDEYDYTIYLFSLIDEATHLSKDHKLERLKNKHSQIQTHYF